MQRARDLSLMENDYVYKAGDFIINMRARSVRLGRSTADVLT